MHTGDALIPARWRIGWLLFFGAGISVVVFLSMSAPRPEHAAAIIYPANALALGSLIMFGRIGRAPELALVGLGALTGLLCVGADLRDSSMGALSDIVCVASTGYLLVVSGGVSDEAPSQKSMVRFAAACILGTIPGSLIGHFLTSFEAPTPAMPLFVAWWMAEVASLLIYLPVFIFWRHASLRPVRPRRKAPTRRVAIGAAVILLALLTALLTLLNQPAIAQFCPLALLLVASQAGPLSTAISAAAFSSFAVLVVIAGAAWGWNGESLATMVLPLQAGLAVGVVPALLLAVGRSQKMLSESRLADHARRLEDVIARMDDGDHEPRYEETR